METQNAIVKIKRKNTARLPGFGLTLGLSLVYMSFLILIPLSALVLYSARLSPKEFWTLVLDERVLSAFKVSFSSTFFAAAINFFFGLIIAWVLTRYQFPGKRFIDAFIDLPFAIPTAVAGISLAAIFAPTGILGSFLQKFGISLGFSKAGIVIALIFIGMPFVVRTVQPIIEELDKSVEEAASSLGANFFQIFVKVIFPSVFPALLTGFAMAFARGLGEYGSIIFISSNMPYESEIVPLLIIKKLMQFDYKGASAIGVSMLVCAFVLLFCVNMLQVYTKKRRKI
ncbi:sulfate ABC transporter permease subunit CysT [Treponema endosymbiont of Eucomonympha sp.]|uniref:sulfate ABC transporter permease subunit CysT n=1 Tax=Treponema endosymbiont of Eucomonympha sp. TaxID=1580831 RepID=UPI0007514CEC|nr:sulfate ABC transporter permease subunit CysT [Treponema endosymbiont of Eucomonympha sp.]